MSALSKLWEKLSKQEYRDAFVGSQIKRFIPLQIRALRKQRDWTQADLAKHAGVNQGSISRAEDPEYGNLTINNLLQIAKGFDVALAVRFVPFSELGRWVNDLSEERLAVPGFSDDQLESPHGQEVAHSFKGSTLGTLYRSELRGSALGQPAQLTDLLSGTPGVIVAAGDANEKYPWLSSPVPRKPASQATSAVNPQMPPTHTTQEVYGNRASCR